MLITQPVIVTPLCTGDGSPLTAAAAASAIPANCKFTLPNNYWYVGRMWRLTACGRVSTVITTPGTSRFDLRIGGVVAFDTLAMVLDTLVAYTNIAWRLDVMLTCRAVGNGTATNLMGCGTYTAENVAGSVGATKGSLTAMTPWQTAPAVGTGFDNTAQNAVDFFFTQTVATGSMTLHQYLIEELN